MTEPIKWTLKTWTWHSDSGMELERQRFQQWNLFMGNKILGYSNLAKKLWKLTSRFAMKQIKVGKTFAFVDDEDFDRVSKFSWNELRSNTRYNPPSYARSYRTLMHRMIMSFPDGVIDHIDHNGLNNQKSNLRIADHSKNRQNVTKVRVNQFGNPPKSKYKGVTFHPGTGKWMSRCKLHGKRHYLGLFVTEEEAAVAYNSKAIELHGEFAYLNVFDAS